MADSCTYASILLLLVVGWGSQSCCYAFGTFGFDIHHRYSDPVKGFLDLDDLPEKGSPQYYAAMAHRDRFIRGRGLAEAVNSTHLTFLYGNETYRLNSLGFLHYANVSVGTPSLSFLVALDTGSDLFWLPCDCGRSCVNGLMTRAGELDLNIYSRNASSTSLTVPCNSTLCHRRSRCSTVPDTCPYRVAYLSDNTSSAGILVEDLLHLATDDGQLREVDAQITFGCGMDQTGSFLDGAAPNGLLGLGMDNVSVPSILASKGLVANSFSMCFGPDGVGRMTFGDKGSSGQRETPFNLDQSHRTYNISITQIIVEQNATDLDFSAIFDSGTSFTYINDPAYTAISESFNSQAQQNRSVPDSSIPFEYCYELSANQTSFETPMLNLTMQGGNQFYVTDPIVIVALQGRRYIYCLAIVKSEDVNIIGQNFMTGHHIVFDRERMVLGWTASDCYDAKSSNTLPFDPRNNSNAVPPIATAPNTTVQPEATSGPGNDTPTSNPSTVQPPPPLSSNSRRVYSSIYKDLVVTFSLFIHCFIILFS